MNLKKAKHIRSYLRERLGVDQPQHMVQYDVALVPSRRFLSVTVTNKDGTVTEHANKAINVRMTRDSPRSMYQRIKGKQNVQNSGRA